jgi:hypothetical protein
MTINLNTIWVCLLVISVFIISVFVFYSIHNSRQQQMETDSNMPKTYMYLPYINEDCSWNEYMHILKDDGNRKSFSMDRLKGIW